MQTPTHDQYVAHERELEALFLRRVETAPLADRKAAQADYYQLLTEPEVLEERASWLLSGQYGYGACLQAVEIQRATRGNRTARLAFLVAAHECQCPQAHATAAWRRLDARQRRNVELALRRALKTEPAITL